MSASSMFMWKRSARSRTFRVDSESEQGDAGLDRVDQVGLVAVQRLEEQRDAVLPRRARRGRRGPRRGSRAPSARSTPSPLRPCIEPMIAGAPSGPARSMIERTKARGLVRGPPGRREVSVQPVLHPARAGADGRQGEAVVVEERAEVVDVDGVRPGREDLDGVEAELLRLAAGRRAGRARRRTGPPRASSTRLTVTADRITSLAPQPTSTTALMTPVSGLVNDGKTPGRSSKPVRWVIHGPVSIWPSSIRPMIRREVARGGVPRAEQRPLGPVEDRVLEAGPRRS